MRYAEAVVSVCRLRVRVQGMGQSIAISIPEVQLVRGRCCWERGMGV